MFFETAYAFSFYNFYFHSILNIFSKKTKLNTHVKKRTMLTKEQFKGEMSKKNTEKKEKMKMKKVKIGKLQICDL